MEDDLLRDAVQLSCAEYGMIRWRYVEGFLQAHGFNRTAKQAGCRYDRIPGGAAHRANQPALFDLAEQGVPGLDAPAAPAPVIAQGVPVAFGFEVHAYINLN